MEERNSGDDTEGEERDLRWEGVSNPHLFLSCLREMNMVICHTQKKKKHELMVDLYWRAEKKKKENVETTDCTKRSGKVFKRPPQMSKLRSHNSRIIESTTAVGIALSNVEYTSSRFGG